MRDQAGQGGSDKPDLCEPPKYWQLNDTRRAAAIISSTHFGGVIEASSGLAANAWQVTK